MKLYVMLVVGLISALAPLACPDTQTIAPSVSDTLTKSTSVSDAQTKSPSISNFPSKEVNQNLGNIINSVPNSLDSSL
jgi:hypothetical protein